MQATTTSHPKDVVSHTKLHRHGAEAAREAHNLEDTGSKPVAGISHSRVYRIRHAVSTHSNTSPGWRRGSARGS